MSRHELAVLACKILALWVVVQIAYLLENFLYMIFFLFKWSISSNEADRNFAMANVTFGVLVIGLAIIAAILWYQAPRLAKSMVSQDPAPVTSGKLTMSDIMLVAFATLGIFILVNGLKESVRLLLTGIWGTEPFRAQWNNGLWQAGFWAAVIQAALGAWLVFGSKGIVRFVIWLRTAGVYDNSKQS